ncbi:MAG: phosphate transport system regulatory protein PhoU [Candidatus Abyssobacteria bacterium SURF_17]|jgi:phosphate transport system protein|uniref:Phosphate-specific transport system accessory protein PhoU n=1 Tax=Candidatus Abyssobacteria bacterium SURF_17 TaxID=2093361 RepID=A0A419ES64_9BACT|nr:MAG: phosphate transport system regulatory protein PhoU [Candidatus Abyssubacteria bacterium SURF_17]
MVVHLQKEIEKLKKNILYLAAVVEENVRRAVRSIETRDSKLAEKVIEVDLEIDRREVWIEEDCLKILALHQPVAIDLRFITAVLKLNNDLERIGDLAVNIAERSIYLSSTERTDATFDYRPMIQKTEAMLNESLNALVNMNPQLARKVCEADDDVDEMERRIVAHAEEAIRKNPEQADRLLHHMFVARHLERIADHATNIAEDVIYMVEGEIVRHGIKIRDGRQEPR